MEADDGYSNALDSDEGWLPLQSSNVDSMRYLARRQTLLVRFHWGGAYAYTPVPPAVAQRLLKAPSPGAFVHSVLKPGYAATRVE